MSRKKSTRKGKTRKPRKAGVRLDPRMIRRVGVPSLAFAVLIGGVLGMGVLDRALAGRARTVMGDRPVEIVIHWPGDAGDADDPEASWIPRALREDIKERLREALGSSPDPLSIEPLRRVSEAAAASGWFDGSVSVVRLATGAVEVVGAWRTPRAWIRSDGVDYLVDDKGRLMPMFVAAEVERPARLAVTTSGVRPPRGADGGYDYQRVWVSERMWEGIRLAELLREQPFAHQVRLIDSADRHGLVIVTDRGSRILWGSGPESFRPGERPTDEKLHHLRSFFEDPKFGNHIDAGTSGYDLRAGYIVFDEAGRGDPG